MSFTQLANIRMVLVRTFHAGNIGSACRSMKTMGLSNLALVEPRDYPSEEADKMAAGALDQLQQARVFDHLPAAIEQCTTVIACTARSRAYDLPELNTEQAAQLLLEDAQKNPVAVVFGPERMGLHNDDIQYAKYRLTVDANPDYSSLNLASAVQIVSYEIYKQFRQQTEHAGQSEQQGKLDNRELPTSAQVEYFYQQLEQTLLKTKFLRQHQGETLQRIRHLFSRAQPDTLELNILC